MARTPDMSLWVATVNPQKNSKRSIFMLFYILTATTISNTLNQAATETLLISSNYNIILQKYNQTVADIRNSYSRNDDEPNTGVGALTNNQRQTLLTGKSSKTFIQIGTYQQYTNEKNEIPLKVGDICTVKEDATSAIRQMLGGIAYAPELAIITSINNEKKECNITVMKSQNCSVGDYPSKYNFIPLQFLRKINL